jgi:cell division transport system permease protein
MSLNLLYSMREGIVGMKRARMASIITVSTIAITMTLLGLFLILTFNIQGIAQSFRNKMTFEVFIDNSLESTDIQLLEKNIMDLEAVEDVTFISKEEALERYRRDFENDPLEIVGYNPLPSSFQVKLKQDYRYPERAEDVVRKTMELEGVDKVVYHENLFRLVYRYSRIVILVDVALFLTVLLAAILLVANTLRLTILSQRKTIQIMELVGATEGFIRRPYLIQGMLQGGIGGGIGSFIVWIVVQGVSLRFPEFLRVTIPMLLFPLVLGLALGFIGAAIGLGRFLKTA